jgi:hypothetical protein
MYKGRSRKAYANEYYLDCKTRYRITIYLEGNVVLAITKSFINISNQLPSTKMSICLQIKLQKSRFGARSWVEDLFAKNPVSREPNFSTTEKHWNIPVMI